MRENSNSSSAFVIKPDELAALNYLSPDHPHPQRIQWINRGTDQELKPSTVAMLLRTLYLDIASPSVVRLHRSAGLRVVFRNERDRERFARAQANGFTGGEGGDASSEAFPAQRIKDRIHAELSKALDRFQNVPGGPPPQMVAGLQHAEQSAFAAVDEMHQAFRDAFADAIRAIYRVTAWLAVLAFLITLFLPEIPLRRGAHQGAAAQPAH